ncbi:hypothetical protein GCM10011357_18760 [Lacimicrobium alkaliphilum]|uniref:Transposase n=1 Tax=Lacimicrobium alkaliphilum TaxID=1526571 RepID=A0ABQ1RC76_9ALTE|nr:hypothetical protein GCM10011357_18760 [Lacimicrobium alkaliphilum]
MKQILLRINKKPLLNPIRVQYPVSTANGSRDHHVTDKKQSHSISIDWHNAVFVNESGRWIN